MYLEKWGCHRLIRDSERYNVTFFGEVLRSHVEEIVTSPGENHLLPCSLGPRKNMSFHGRMGKVIITLKSVLNFGMNRVRIIILN